MGDPQTNIWQELNVALTKALGWLIWVTIGVAAKLAFESRTKKLSWREIIVIVVISVFSGYIANAVCNKTGYRDWSGVVVPISTLLGQSLMNWVMVNWKNYLEKWADKWLPPALRSGTVKKDKDNSSL
jgi:hypothetical protein